MNQRFEDLKLVLKNDRRIWAGGGLLILLLIIAVSMSSTGGRRNHTPGALGGRPLDMPGASSISEGPEIQSMMIAMQQDNEKKLRQIQEQGETLQRIKTDFEDHRSKVTGIFESLVEKVEGLGNKVEELQKENEKLVADRAQGQQGPGLPGSNVGGSGLEIFGGTSHDVPKPASLPPIRPTKITVISSADSVPIKLLTGVNAPVDGIIPFSIGPVISGLVPISFAPRITRFTAFSSFS